MSENNRLSNGRFLHDLDNWTTSAAAYSAGDGDDHYGVAVLEVGGYISQTFSVQHARSYTLHIAIKGAATSSAVTFAITDGDGNAVTTQSVEGVDGSWSENTYTLGLAGGTTYTLKISNVSAAAEVKLDDVWLWYVPITRAEIATRVEARLGSLASGLSTSASGDKTEGDYTYAIDAGLRAVGAVNRETGKPDTRYLTAQNVDAVIDAVEREMLARLENTYAVQSDIKVGQRSEDRSQIASAIARKLEKSGGSARSIAQRRIVYDD